MNLIKKTVLTLFFILLLVVFSMNIQSSVHAQNATAPLAGAQLAADEANHPHIRHALHALQEARKELEIADHDFGGHRVAAMQSCDAAIQQLKLALEVAPE